MMRSLSDTAPGIIADLLRRSPLSPGKVDFAWSMAVGSAIQRASAVRLENGLLLVDAADERWAREIRRASGMILTRLQYLLGADVITAIQVRRRT